jgi:Fe-S-cluster-containing hydrogenase component 2
MAARKTMSKILMIYPKKCKNCGTCESVCSNGAVNVIHFEEAVISVPVMCMQCEEAACLKVCPSGALSRDENDAVVVDASKCIGCKVCVSSCPMGNIHYSPRLKKIMKCNLCNGDPDCVKYCPTRAIEYEEGSAANLAKKTLLASKFIDLFDEEQD